jgi:hypothetical protein
MSINNMIILKKENEIFGVICGFINPITINKNAQVDSTQHMNPHHEWLVEGIIWTIIIVIFLDCTLHQNLPSMV